MTQKRDREHNRPVKTQAWIMPVCLLVPAALLLALALRWDFYYDLNDDAAMANILSGAYTGTPALRNIQSYFPLTAVLGGLKRLFSGAEWYGVFLLAVQSGCLALILHRILRKNTIPLPGSAVQGSLASEGGSPGGAAPDDSCGRAFAGNAAGQSALLIALTVLAYLALLLPHLVFVQYSVTVGILGATAAFLFLTMEPRSTVKGWILEILPQLLLIWLGFLLRSEMLLFLSPLIALAFLIRWADMELPVVWKIKSALLTLTLVLAGLAAGYLGNEIGYASEEWQEFYAFFDARTQLYDFEKLPEYEGNEDFYESIGLGEAEADLIINYNFGIDDNIDADILQQIADYADAKAGAEQTAKERLSSALWDYRHAEDEPYTTIAAVLYILAVLAAAVLLLSRQVRQALLRLLELAVLLAGRSALLLYLYYNQRPVERLTHSLYLIEAVILIWMMVSGLKGQKGLLRISFPAALIVLFLWAAVVQYAETGAEYAVREETNEDWLAFLTYCEDHPETVYFTDVYSTVSFSEKIFADTPAAANYDLLGGWMSKSPLELQKLTALGLAEDAASGENEESGPTTGQIIETALLTNENCYYAARSDYDTDWLVSYYASRDIAVQVVPVDTIGDYWIIYEVQEKP